LDAINLDAADDLFSLDNLAEMLKEEPRERGKMSYEQAIEVGILALKKD
jgi:hypothetical protein